MNYKPIVYPAIITVMVMLATLIGITRGEFWHSDSSRHAMNGVFIKDLLHSWPAHPVLYAREYYAQYPALSLAYHPPLFPLVESFFFSVLGASAATARMVVAGFTLLFLLAWYFFIARGYNRETALWAALVLGSTPYMVLLARSVLLELPVLAMAIMAIYFYYKFMEGKRDRDYVLCLIFLVASILTKQTAVFLLLFFLLYALVTQQLKLFFTAKRITGLGFLAVFMIVYVGLEFSYAPALLSQFWGGWGQYPRLGWDNWLYYFSILPQQITWLVITGSILFGIWLLYKSVIALKNKKVFNLIQANKLIVFFVVWLASCYLFFSLVSVKYPRHTVYWLPVWTLFAVLLCMKFKKFHSGQVLAGMIVVVQIYRSFVQPYPYIAGYEQAARQVVQEFKPSRIFFDGYYDGNFIFFTRKYDNARRVTVVRSNRKLYDIPVMVNFGARQLVRNKDDIAAMLKNERIDYIVVEDKPYYNFAAGRLLRELLQTGPFMERARFPLQARNIDGFTDNALIVYQVQ